MLSAAGMLRGLRRASSLPVAARMKSLQSQPRFSTLAAPLRPVRPAHITSEERAAIRAARKERATAALRQAQGGGTAVEVGTASTAATATSTSSSKSSGFLSNPKFSRWLWYVGLGAPTVLITWAIYDESSPPAQVAQAVGLTSLIGDYTSQLSQPVYDKLLPDWADVSWVLFIRFAFVYFGLFFQYTHVITFLAFLQMPDMPQDIPVPHTLVLDLEKTLVSSTWDRKYGWRHAKRPGVDKFLRDMAQYYEIVLYSPSFDGVALPVVDSLDKEGCIRHRLYRDAMHYYKGVHVKDLKRLNRNIKRMVVIDDDPEEV